MLLSETSTILDINSEYPVSGSLNFKRSIAADSFVFKIKLIAFNPGGKVVPTIFNIWFIVISFKDVELIIFLSDSFSKSKL